MTAVACTGAAASPAAGKFTGSFPGWRMVFALFNIRLGAWVPNPISNVVRQNVADKAMTGWKLDRPRAMGPGFDEFVPELFGLHSRHAARAYLSDGGHYDNLGILCLLRERCAEIWCVDSQADKNGAASQIREVLSLAQDELGIAVDIDLDRFAGERGVYTHTYAVGDIHYESQFDEPVLGKLFVIKLGLDANSPLRAYQDSDPKFPFHSTFKTVALGPARMRAYVDLGRENTTAACAAWTAAQVDGLEPGQL
jgi:hypothetical protein